MQAQLGDVIASLDQLSVEWLSAVLQRAGAMSAGGVAAFNVAPMHSDNSTMTRITLRYAPGSTGELPIALLLKRCMGGVFGPSEVLYHTRDYVDLPDAPLPRCYDGVYSAEQQCYHLLMDDLSLTHRNNFDVAPTLDYGRAVADALARLHAHCWGPARLRALSVPMPSVADVDRYLMHIEPGLEPLLTSIDGEVDPTWLRVLPEIWQHHSPLLCARVDDGVGFTLVHGDTNPGNILSPRNGIGPTYLLDRQPFDWKLMTWLGASDLAYTMVHWWDTELRRQLEMTVLRQYHTMLLQRGVADYTWEQLWDDYRLCAVQSLHVVIEWCVLEHDRTNMRWVWWPQLHKAMTAFFDLRCAELWR